MTRASNLRAGIFLAPFHPVDEDPTLAIRRDIEESLDARDASNDERWVAADATTLEELDADERRVEGLQLAIRTRDGVPGADVADATLEELDGLIERTADDRVVLTPSGRLLANEVAIRLG